MVKASPPRIQRAGPKVAPLKSEDSKMRRRRWFSSSPARSLAGLAMVETGGLSPLAYLLRVMRDETETPARRMDAAKTAAPFVHPKLATMDVQSAGLDRMGDALAELIERAQGDGGGVGGLLGR